MESPFYVLALATVGGYDTEVVCCAQGRCWNVEGGSLGIGPNSCSLRAVDILYNFVLHIPKDIMAFLVFCFADICSNFDEKSVFLGS